MAKKWDIDQKKTLRRRSPSYLLLETLVVLAVLISILSFAVPIKTHIDALLLQNDIKQLHCVMTYLQQKAIASNRTLTLRLNTQDNSYAYSYGAYSPVTGEPVTDKSGPDKSGPGKPVLNRLSPSIAFGFLPGAKGPPSRPVSTITKSVTFKHATIQFHPNGMISPGSVYLIDTRQNFMKALTCSVSRVSFIRMYTYHLNQWVA